MVKHQFMIEEDIKILRCKWVRGMLHVLYADRAQKSHSKDWINSSIITLLHVAEMMKTINLRVNCINLIPLEAGGHLNQEINFSHILKRQLLKILWRQWWVTKRIKIQLNRRLKSSILLLSILMCQRKNCHR